MDDGFSGSGDEQRMAGDDEDAFDGALGREIDVEADGALDAGLAGERGIDGVDLLQEAGSLDVSADADDRGRRDALIGEDDEADAVTGLGGRVGTNTPHHTERGVDVEEGVRELFEFRVGEAMTAAEVRGEGDDPLLEGERELGIVDAD